MLDKNDRATQMSFMTQAWAVLQAVQQSKCSAA